MEANDIVDMASIKIIVTAAVTALVTWLATAGRQAIRNIGKTKVEIATHDLEDATRRFMEAKATADPSDDVAAQVALDRAKHGMEKAQIVKAVTDAADTTEG